MMTLTEALQVISRDRSDAVVIPTMTAGWVWPMVSSRRELDLPLYGCMGKAASLGLGLALARPERKVLVLDGDGSLLMNLGTLVTVAQQAPPNLYHFVMVNSVYQETGGQPIPGAKLVDFPGLARDAGYPVAHQFDDLEDLASQLPEILARPGPALLAVRVLPQEEQFPVERKTAQAISEVQRALARR